MQKYATISKRTALNIDQNPHLIASSQRPKNDKCNKVQKKKTYAMFYLQKDKPKTNMESSVK